MDSHATAPRYAAPLPDASIEAVICAAGRRARGKPADVTPALVQYWCAWPQHPLDSRRCWLESTRAAVRRGETTSRAFVVPALGDVDETIVAEATVEYVGAHLASIERRQAAVNDAAEWIRRGLALNRAAVFAALLSFGDAWIDELLAGLRLILSHREIATVCARVAQRPSRATRAFLCDWAELLNAAEQPDHAALELVAAALQAMRD